MQADAAGWDSLAIREADSASGGALASLWLGGENVTTQAHYDVDHNVHVQLSGTKRWLLFPPDAAADLALFGFLHPRYRTSQVALPTMAACMAACMAARMAASSPRRDALGPLEPEVGRRFPGAASALRRAALVELRAGDALYLPPFFIHHVTGLVAGGGDDDDPLVLSLNVFSTSRVWEQLNAIDAVALPFEQEWLQAPLPLSASSSSSATATTGSKQPTLLAAALAWIQLVLSTTGHDAKAAATELLRGGYHTASSATPQDERSARRDVCGTSAAAGNEDGGRWYDAARERAFRERAASLGAIAQQIQAAEGAAVARLAILRHVEMVLFNFVGLHDAQAFLERCLLGRRPTWSEPVPSHFYRQGGIDVGSSTRTAFV